MTMTNQTKASNVPEVAIPVMDWGQVVANGGPPCFYAEGPQFCGRAERWAGHGNPAFHEYVSLGDYTHALREQNAKLRAALEKIGKRIGHINHKGDYYPDCVYCITTTALAGKQEEASNDK